MISSSATSFVAELLPSLQAKVMHGQTPTRETVVADHVAALPSIFDRSPAQLLTTLAPRAAVRCEGKNDDAPTIQAADYISLAQSRLV